MQSETHLYRVTVGVKTPKKEESVWQVLKFVKNCSKRGGVLRLHYEALPQNKNALGI